MQKNVLLSLTLVVLTLCFFYSIASADEPNPSDTSLRVEKVAICRGVEQRTPLGIGNVFTSDAGKLFCFTKVVGARSDTLVIHRWFLNGDLRSSVELPVKSSRWRTWSTKRIDTSDVGDWMVEIVAEDGVVLATIIFFIQ